MKRVVTKASRMHRISGLLAGCLAGVALLATASAASAATYHPTRTDDPAPNDCKPNDCSLREAVIASRGKVGASSAIVLRAGKHYVLTRRGLGEDASLAGDLDLGPGKKLTVRTRNGRCGAKPAVIDGNDIDRIFDGGQLRLEGVVLRDGHARIVPGDDGRGGAIRVGGRLNIKNSRLVSNVADDDGGAIGGSSDVFINKTLLKGNRAGGDGGAIGVFGGQNSGITNSQPHSQQRRRHRRRHLLRRRKRLVQWHLPRRQPRRGRRGRHLSTRRSDLDRPVDRRRQRVRGPRGRDRLGPRLC